MNSLKNFSSYPKVRELAKKMPALDSFKVNLILKYLVRCGHIIIDNDGYIIWVKGNSNDALTLGDVAKFEGNFKDYFKQNGA